MRNALERNHGLIAVATIITLAAPVLLNHATAQEISGAWVRGTVKGQSATGAFMQIKTDRPMSLVSAASPVAAVVELHEMAMQGGVMSMRAIPKLDVAPGKDLDLKPGGRHVMLMDLNRELKAGETVPISLRFRSADNTEKVVEIKAEVAPLTKPAARH
jgi:hypothetical protein